MDPQLKSRLRTAQVNEITEHEIYSRLAARMADQNNRDVLQHIADDEKSHYEFWAEYTGEQPRPAAWRIWFYVTLARVLGLTFAVKLMEMGEEAAQISYAEVAETIPEAKKVLNEEEEHEQQLLAMIDEERLQYAGSIVLGLSDALVELTGALAGFTLALQNSRLIALIGLITGIAASMSMAASEYLSVKTEDAEEGKSPIKSATYTGIAYITTVLVLVAPYLVLPTALPALALALTAAVLIIAAFTFYIAVARDLPFKRRFAEMAGLTLGVALISFLIGYILRLVFGVDV